MSDPLESAPSIMESLRAEQTRCQEALDEKEQILRETDRQDIEAGGRRTDREGVLPRIGGSRRRPTLIPTPSTAAWRVQTSNGSRNLSERTGG